MLNDIYGFRRDASIARIAADAGVPAVAMHNQRGREPGDVIARVLEGLRESIAIAEREGLPRERLIVDPGFGFGWRPEQNIEMLRRLGELRELGLPLLVGTSRKSTIGAVLGGADVPERIFGTAASVALVDRRRRRHRPRARRRRDEAGGAGRRRNRARLAARG